MRTPQRTSLCAVNEAIHSNMDRFPGSKDVISFEKSFNFDAMFKFSFGFFTLQMCLFEGNSNSRLLENITFNLFTYQKTFYVAYNKVCFFLEEQKLTDALILVLWTSVSKNYWNFDDTYHSFLPIPIIFGEQ